MSVLAGEGVESGARACAHGPAYSLTDTNCNSYTQSYTNPCASVYNNAFVDSYGNSDFEPHFHAQSHSDARPI